MAKGKKHSKGTRDTSESLTGSPLRSRPLSTITVTPTQDFRSFLDAPVSSPARLFNGSTADVTVDPLPKKRGRLKVPYQIAFTAPHETVVCVRRHRRRAVLHALKKTGKRGQSRPRKTRFRDIKC